MDPQVEKVSLESPIPSEVLKEKLQELLPGAVTDGVLDAQRLADLLDVDIAGLSERPDRFGLNWAGKKSAAVALQTPSRAALAPDMTNSIDWDTAENVFIEGDNLEVLKLLQKAYNDKVKLIYIDPPYNTGNDFVYNDDFSDPIKHYLEVTGQVDADGNRLVANTEISGRKHSNWLNMMYSRLSAARNLLSQDGAIFVSIDDNELGNLTMLLNEIFGEENHVGTFIWAAGRKNDSKFVSTSHEYIISYCRNREKLKAEVEEWRKKKAGLEIIYSHYDSLRNRFGEDHSRITSEMKKWYKELSDSEPAKQHKHYCHSDARGLYFPDNISSPGGGPKYEILHPVTNRPVKVPSRGWVIFDPEKMQALIDDNRIHFGLDETTVPCRKRFLKDTEFEAPYSVFYKDGRAASKRLATFLEGNYFPFPKDELVLRDIIGFASNPGDIVMDFFAGSGTTGHAVALQNAEDGGKRKYVLVNIPEPTDEKSVAKEAGIETVSEITRMRLKKVTETVPGAREQGLRCLSLSKSSFIDTTPQGSGSNLVLFKETLSPHASDDAIVAEALLKSGVMLDKPWQRLEVQKTHVVVCYGVAVALARRATEDLVKGILELQDVHTVIFLEDAFEGADDVKSNASYAFKRANKNMKSI